jgi:sulfate adenylyltransferase subunit 1 (EFTu-like GTPase family)
MVRTVVATALVFFLGGLPACSESSITIDVTYRVSDASDQKRAVW